MDNANELLKRIKAGSEQYHFVEFMACPGGCISGGGQPKSALPPDDKMRAVRTNALYSIDEKLTLRLCHENPELLALYKDYIGEPNGHIAHELLHTHEYYDRSEYLVAKR
jgi:iron only hydrogenase large subunit-like protein